MVNCKEIARAVGYCCLGFLASGFFLSPLFLLLEIISVVFRESSEENQRRLAAFYILFMCTLLRLLIFKLGHLSCLICFSLGQVCLFIAFTRRVAQGTHLYSVWYFIWIITDFICLLYVIIKMAYEKVKLREEGAPPAPGTIRGRLHALMHTLRQQVGEAVGVPAAPPAGPLETLLRGVRLSPLLAELVYQVDLFAMVIEELITW